jgi:hypothetical protein
MKSITFWDMTSHLLACWFLAKLIYSTLKMEAICSSETSVDTQRTTRRHIPEDDTLHNHGCENLISYMYFCSFLVSCLTMLTVSRTYSVDDKIINKCGSICRIRTGRGIWNAQRKTASVPLFPTTEELGFSGTVFFSTGTRPPLWAI